MASDNRSLAELLSAGLTQLSSLVQTEVRLAKAELSLRASQAATGAALLAGAALLLIPSLVLILMALAAWLEHLGLPAAVADLLGGVAGLVVSVVIALAGRQRLDPKTLTPTRTLQQLHRDAVAVKTQV
jgi:uncharacterized membrane protein YqjE